MTDTRVPAAPETQAPQPAETRPVTSGGNPRARRRGLLLLGLAVAIAAIVWAVFHFLFAAPEQETDDAYVAGDVVAITARDPGTVLAVHADNTQTVRAGQPLIDLDAASADVALAAAAADLARAVRATRSSFSAVDETDAAVTQAAAQLAQAQGDLGRRRGAAAQGAVSGEELSHAQDQVRVAAASLRLSRSRAAQSRNTVQGTTVDTNPAVLTAVAAYRRAAIIVGHMHVAAPVAGVVAQRTVQIGQQVAAGTPLMAVVPLDRLWVDANFRETQLRNLRIGQPARVVADVYGDEVIYHGRVVGLGAGSGSAFALLPAQNASGNWIKITQRVPVRIMLDPRELRANPLRVGLSVAATVDTADVSGTRIGQPGRSSRTGLRTAGGDPAVEERIRRIIAANR